ncbi:MAG: ABC transporter permease [Nocardioidaceae bacterium]|nr:ABC transporter permease [Nocardioidaceae bacterium]
MDQRVATYAAKRALACAFIVWGIATLVFLMIKAIPGDEAQSAAGITATPAQVEQVRHRLGLDHSLPVQYVDYLGRLAHGDLGTSIVSFRPVREELTERIPASVELVGSAMLLDVLVGVPLGMLAAARFRRTTDNVVRWVAILASAVPLFWLGLMLQSFVGLKLDLLPLSGSQTIGKESPRVTGMATVDALLAGNLSGFGDAVAHLVLPAVTLSIPFIGFVSRITRSSIVGTLQSDFASVVRAKGASESRIVVRHALPNSLGPIVTFAALQFGWMFSATVLVESIFGRPGVGSYLADSVTQKDTFAVLGLVLFIGTVVAVASAVADMIQLLVDPRIRAAQVGAPA